MSREQGGGPDGKFVRPDGPALWTEWRKDGPPVRWERTLGGGYSGIVTRDDVVYTAYRDGESDIVIAMAASDGVVKWRHRDHAPALEDMAVRYGPGPHSTPLVTETTVFDGGEHRSFARPRPRDGRTALAGPPVG